MRKNTSINMQNILAKIKRFLHTQKVEISMQQYFIKSLSAMSCGLFSSLIVGVILKTIGQQLNIQELAAIGDIAMKSTGAAIGASVAVSLNAPLLVIFSTISVGMTGYDSGPAGSFVASIIACECGKLASGQTKLDIIITPTITLIIGILSAWLISPVIAKFMSYIGALIMSSTDMHPIIMSIIVATVMGVILTLPISSAAIAIMLDLNGLTAGAATIGCASHMVGFAVISYKANGLSGAFAQGIGTSMLQMANIVKKPIIVLPVVIASILIAPIGIYMHMSNSAIGAGMGTSGLVGQFSTFTTMGFNTLTFAKILLLHFLLPALVSLVCYQLMKMYNIVQDDDLKLNI